MHKTQFVLRKTAQPIVNHFFDLSVTILTRSGQYYSAIVLFPPQRSTSGITWVGNNYFLFILLCGNGIFSNLHPIRVEYLQTNTVCVQFALPLFSHQCNLNHTQVSSTRKLSVPFELHKICWMFHLTNSNKQLQARHSILAERFYSNVPSTVFLQHIEGHCSWNKQYNTWVFFRSTFGSLGAVAIYIF